MKTEHYSLPNQHSRQELIRLIQKLDISEPCMVTIDYGKKRTVKQNASLYKWERLLAHKLNSAGISFGQVVLRWPRWFTQENIHELIVKPVMKALYPDKESTSELSTTEIQEVWQHCDQVIAERVGVRQEWPDRHGGGGIEC